MFDIQIIDAIVTTVRLSLEAMSTPGLFTELVQQAGGHLVEATNFPAGLFVEPASVSGEVLEAATATAGEVSLGPVWETLSVSNPSVQ